MLSPKPLTRTARVLAGILAAVCVGSGGLGVFLGIHQNQVLLVVVGAAAIAFGFLYARAAWLGRPLRLPDK
jgi:ABC-type proline/glycine betaine transport system permease subunit